MSQESAEQHKIAALEARVQDLQDTIVNKNMSFANGMKRKNAEVEKMRGEVSRTESENRDLKRKLSDLKAENERLKADMKANAESSSQDNA